MMKPRGATTRPIPVFYCYTRWILLLALLAAVDIRRVHAQAETESTVSGQADQSLGGSQLEQMIITPFYDHSVNSLSEDQQKLIKNVLMEPALSWFHDVLKVRPMSSGLLLDRECESSIHYLVKAEKYCQGDCAPVTKCGPVTIPEEHLKPCRRCDNQGKNCEVASDQQSSDGITNSHFLLYVSVLDETTCRTSIRTPLYAGHCQQERDFDRPVAGYLNICPGRLSTDPAHFQVQMAAVFRKLIQTLVFSEELFPFYHDESGRPRTWRTVDGNPGRNLDGSYTVDPNTLRSVWRTQWTTINDDIFHAVQMIVTPKVVQEVRLHFNCSTLIGAELENQGGLGSAMVHWEKRLFGDELMTASPGSNPVISRITLALFEDSGWYKPDYSYGGQLQWGKDLGCVFAQESCSGWKEHAKSNRVDSAPFCDAKDWRNQREGCVDQRSRVGPCSLKNYTYPLPQEYQYLSARTGGSQAIADYCPKYYAVEYGSFKIGRSCSDAADVPAVNIALESYGPDSRCFEQDNRWVMKVNDTVISRQTTFGAGCYQFSCSARRVFIHVGGVSVRCSGQKGTKKTVKVTKNGITYVGSFVCPSYEEICSNYDCVNLCSVHGTCVNGYCKCQPGFFGDDCSRNYAELMLSCSDVSCQNGGTCQDSTLGFTCVCPPGFTGAYCDSELVPDPCSNLTCHTNGGLCGRYRLGTNQKCDCYPGYEGKSCNQVIDYCARADRACIHGQCLNDTTPTCVCDAGSSGELCNIKSDYCIPDPCENGATCVNHLESSTYSCICPSGYEGVNCESVDPCDTAPCYNDATCQRLSNTEFSCVCPEGHTGELCNEKTNYCEDSPCLNQATCVSLDTTYKCICARGYKGKKCRKRTNPCSPNPCLNNGNCNKNETAPYGHIFCRCQDGFQGEFCEERVPTCTPNPCLNGASCTDFGNGNILCNCTSGYMGQRCGEIRDPCISGPCMNSGECIAQGLNYSCSCEDGYSGHNCENFDYCAVHQCANGGTCVSEGYCLCRLGFGGDNCSDIESKLPRFSGSSYMSLAPLPMDSTSSFEISISIKPQTPDGLIFHRWEEYGGDFISLGLQNGIIVYKFDCGTGPTEIRSRQKLELNQWHVVTAVKHEENGTLHVSSDPGYIARGNSRGSFMHVQVENGLIYLGGYSNLSALPEKIGNYVTGFHGCISHLEMDGSVIDFVATAWKLEGITQCRSSPCTTNSLACEHGGVCRASSFGYWCECPAGYTGVTCSRTYVPTIPSFDGRSFLALEAPVGAYMSIDLSITLTPTTNQGVIFVLTSNTMAGDYMAVGVRNGSVEFYFNQMDMGHGDICVRSSELLETGQPSTIRIHKEGTEGTVQINQGEVDRGVTEEDNRYLHVSQGALMYIGGHPTFEMLPWVLPYKGGVSGCIERVEFNGQALDFGQAVSSRQIGECSGATGM